MNVINTYMPAWAELSDRFVPRPQHERLPLVVLVGDETGFAAYIAIVPAADPHANNYDMWRETMAKAVAAHGTKLTFNMARGFFPQIAQDRYRA